MSGLDQKGTKFPNGVNVDAGELFIDSLPMTASAAELNLLSGVTVSTAELNQYAVQASFADANTAGSIFVTVPHAGNIVGLYAVNSAANTTVKTVLLAKIATVTVTAPAWEIAITQAAGVTTNVVPTAANAIGAGAVIEIASDGGGTPAMPLEITIVISR